MTYTLYIDESGEEGITRIRSANTSGASPWLSFGACLINDNNYENIEATIQELEREFGITAGLHFRNLPHKQKVYACKKLSEIDAVFFGTISNKTSARRGDYLEYIEEESWKYYNKNVQYLFELVGKYFRENNIGTDEHTIIFENKRGVRYNEMKNLMRAINRRPIRKSLEEIQPININSITSKEKHEENLLKVADAVAHSIFQCCENNNFGITETRYLYEMRNRFPSCRERKVLNNGIKAINYVADLRISMEDNAFLCNLKTNENYQANQNIAF